MSLPAHGMAERLAPGVYRVDALRLRNAVNVLLLEGEGGWTLVDTGVASSVPRIGAVLSALGPGLEGLRRVFLTHQHTDHTGGLKGILERAPEAEVWAPEHEADVISGRRGYDPQSGRLLRLMSRKARPPGVRVDRVLRAGEAVEGFRLIATPGHTPGHVSMLRDADGLLFTADAFGCMPRRLRVGVRRAFCTDPPAARRSAQRLLQEDFAAAVMSHGPVLRGAEARERLAGALAGCDYA
ncbi:beta-lactamase-like protein [Rubrobacter xylanophilus DSM 9941]|uniref:Beta-lactamase-like protein n=1 Tax=Rubrobacter xylanophilus (strain DSM 9941 / JCM 11954 / NBRC 16129 / PRD-1) TaxID=266117 RepID=Q1AS02_RUBXD|nr:MBL fold metallo-hydrolase [Rubrobacter xylanophilus]ABG05826.1 beta-lactamase-like protein [Rubrobacter xylanophilus DSM 9941]